MNVVLGFLLMWTEPWRSTPRLIPVSCHFSYTFPNGVDYIVPKQKRKNRLRGIVSESKNEETTKTRNKRNRGEAV